MGWSQVSPFPASYWPDADTCGSGLSPHREVSVQCGTHATKTPLVSPLLRTGFASSEATVKTHSIYTSWIYPYLPVHISGLIICRRYINTYIVVLFIKDILNTVVRNQTTFDWTRIGLFQLFGSGSNSWPLFYRSKDLGNKIPQF